MAGNQEVTDLPVIPAVDGADVYAAKNNLDYRIRTGEAGGLATLNGSGVVTTSQLPTNVWLPLTAGSTVPLTGNLYINKDAPAIVWNDTDNPVGQKRAVMQLHSTNGSPLIYTTADGDAGATQWTWVFDRSDGSFQASGNISTTGRVRAAAHFNATAPGGVAVLSAEGASILLRPNGSDSTVNEGIYNTAGNFTAAGTVTGTGTNAFHFGTGGLAYFTSAAQHIAYYKKNSGGALHFYWRRSDDGNPSGPNEATLMELSDAGKLTVLGGGIQTSGSAASFRFVDRTSFRVWEWYGTSDVAALYNGASNIVTIDAVGNITALNFWATSDKNKKTAIEDKPARRNLADKLRLVSFIWKVGGEEDQGLIAQEVQEVAPEYVKTDAEGFLAVDKVGLLLECVVDLSNRVKELEDATSRKSSD